MTSRSSMGFQIYAMSGPNITMESYVDRHATTGYCLQCTGGLCWNHHYSCCGEFTIDHLCCPSMGPYHRAIFRTGDRFGTSAQHTYCLFGALHKYLQCQILHKTVQLNQAFDIVCLLFPEAAFERGNVVTTCTMRRMHLNIVLALRHRRLSYGLFIDEQQASVNPCHPQA
ncbi:hypothetical protein BDQ17DRAFT_1355855 [Cyathus striatus]|nr:hypothetical protein BDQ17DRAFT_1355855 [Cyathus striatus]